MRKTKHLDIDGDDHTIEQVCRELHSSGAKKVHISTRSNCPLRVSATGISKIRFQIIANAIEKRHRQIRDLGTQLPRSGIDTDEVKR